VAKSCVVVDPDVADVPKAVEVESAVTVLVWMVWGVNLLLLKGKCRSATPHTYFIDEYLLFTL